jgi:hypothetical protein
MKNAFISAFLPIFFLLSYQPAIPDKTVFIKDPAATDHAGFFSSRVNYHFEIFKAGSVEEVQKILKSLQADKKVSSATAGKLTGDYQAIDLSLKQNADKAWFKKVLSGAGLNHIHINNEETIATGAL